MDKGRNSNIELLRIVSILLIIMFHYVYHSGYVFPFDNLSSRDYLLKIFYFFGELGVNLFTLISGYFLVKKKFSFKRLIKLILEINFYHFLLLFISYHFKIPTIFSYATLKDYFLLFFPVIFTRFWYVTAYLMIYCISPFLNILINKMSKTEYKKMLLVTLIWGSIIPTVFGIFFNGSETLMFYNRFIWLVIIYFIGGYMRLYSFKIFSKKRNTNLIALFSGAFMILSMFIFHKYRFGFAALGTTEIAYFWPPNTLPMLLLSISIFQIFINLNIRNIKLINAFASTTLGVYILHDGFLSAHLWHVIIKSNNHLIGPHPFLSILCGSIIIFIVGALIDLIRQLLEKFTIEKILNSKLATKISYCYNIIIKKILKLI